MYVNNSNANGGKAQKFPYSRPEFLQLRTDDEIIVSADHQIRPIILPRDVSRLPWKSGYAECINAGKSLRNEDQAACYQDVAIKESSVLNVQSNSSSDSLGIKDEVPWTYFGIFDGHAGTAVAVAAASQLHKIIGEKLNQVADLLVTLEFDMDSTDEDDDFVDCTNTSLSTPNEEEATKEANTDEKKSENPNETNDKEDSNEIKTIVEDHNHNNNNLSKTTDPEVESANSEQDSKRNIQPNEKENETLTKATTNEEQQSTSGSVQRKIKRTDQEEQSSKDINLSKNKPTLPPNSTNKDQSPVHTAQNVSQNPSSLAHEQRRLPSMIDICRNSITVESLITGALESAFWEMDALIAQDKHNYKMAGGCTAIVSLFILGKLYVCNAGDSRAIVYKNNQVIPMSFDFTPTSERERILRLGLQRPEFLGDDFTHLEFLRRPTRKDLGKQMLYRDAYMTGWSMKTITYNDLKFPLVWGEGKRSRVLATIGVTRGFGDHELRAQYGSVLIKPFLTPEPEVKVLDLENDERLTPEDVLILGSDGLWDVTSNQMAADVVKNSSELFSDNEESRCKYRYITAAQDLVIHSRGHTSYWNSVWRTPEGQVASLDDIAVFVIPLKQYRDEYLMWKKLRSEAVCNSQQYGGPKASCNDTKREN